MASDFWAAVDESVRRLHHSLALRGRQRVTCTACAGKGYSSPGYQDYDGYGAIWREPELCRACAGQCMVEVPCSPDVEAAAVEEEIKRLQARRRQLRKKMKGARDGR